MKKALIFALGLLMLSCAPKGNTAAETASFDQLIHMRRSVRDFDSTKTVSEADVRSIIAAAQEAPSWTNSQPSRYYVALSKEKADAVREVIGDWNRKNTEGAPVFIVSTFVRGLSGFRRDGEPANEVGEGWGAYDNGLSDALLILKARSMGYDTLIMGGRDADAIRGIFDIPEQETIMAVIALGCRASDPQRPARKPLDEILTIF